MADRYPLVVNPTTNQITEIQINDDLQLDDTELTTSTGNLLLNPASEIDCQKNISNSQGDVTINDSLKVVNPVGIQTNAVSTKSLAIGPTWNNASSAFYGVHLDITNTAADAASRLVELNVGGTKVFDIDVSGDVTCNEITVGGDALFNDDVNIKGDGKIFTIEKTDGTDKFTVAATTGNTTIVGDLDVDGQTDLDVVNIDGTLTLSSGLDADSTANFQGEVTFQTGIVPDTDEGAYIGTSNLPFSVAHIAEIQIAPGNSNNTIQSATGNLELSCDGATDKVIIQRNLEINTNGTGANVVIKNTEASASSCPDLALVRHSPSPADDDFLSSLIFQGKNDATPAEDITYARIDTQIKDVTDGTEDGLLDIRTMKAGTLTSTLLCESGNVTIGGDLTVSGTTTTVNSTTLSVADAEIELRTGNNLTAADGGIQVNLTTDGSGNVTASRKLQWNNTATAWQATDSGGTLRTLLTEGNPIKVISSIEDIDLHTNALQASDLTSGDFFYDVIGRNVHWWGGGDATTDFVIDVRGDASTTFANHCANGEAVTFSMLVKNGATARSCTGLKIDGTAQTIRWANATTPSPAANQRIVYTFTIMRHGTTSTSYEVLGSGTNYD